METATDRAVRNVVKAAEFVASQRKLVETLKVQGESTKEAEERLGLLVDAPAVFQDHLADLRRYETIQ